MNKLVFLPCASTLYPVDGKRHTLVSSASGSLERICNELGGLPDSIQDRYYASQALIVRCR